MFIKILSSIALLYVVLAGVTYYNYKRPVMFFGYFFPTSIEIWSWLLIGPVLMLIFGIASVAVGTIMLSPAISLYFGKVWIAFVCMVGLGFLTPYTSLFVFNGVVIKFDFPLNLVFGYITFIILGVGFFAIGVLLLSPILLFLFI